jgi:glycine oxidase
MKVAHSSEPFDAIVVGGGVVGLATGWRLAQRGLRVTILERDAPGHGTTHVAAGMLAPIAEADPAEEPLLRLGVAAAAAYPSFVTELADVAGVDPGYVRCGTLMVARDRDEGEALVRHHALRTSLGLGVERLLPGQARSLEPALAPSLRLALDVPEDHAIDPRQLTVALSAAIGSSLRAGSTVASIDVIGGRVQGVLLADGSRLTAEHVVVAVGPWSGQLDGLPEHARIPVRPVKGQILRLHDPAGPGLLTRVLRMPPAYVVPRGDGRYVLGATVEERGFDTTVTAGAVFELLRDASELVPGISELVIDELSAGLRPGTPDNAPVIGPGALPGLYWATGHYRNGVLLAPITAEIVAAGIAGAPPPQDVSLDAFAPARFARAHAEARP